VASDIATFLSPFYQTFCLKRAAVVRNGVDDGGADQTANALEVK